VRLTCRVVAGSVPAMQPPRVIAEGIGLPEGPVWLRDGDVVVCEASAGRLTRIHPDGTKTVVADLGGTPVGQAIGPDGGLYVCHLTGSPEWGPAQWPFGLANGFTVPQAKRNPTLVRQGQIVRVDLATGASRMLY